MLRPVALSDGDSPIKGNDRRRTQVDQCIVQRHDLFPVVSLDHDFYQFFDAVTDLWSNFGIRVQRALVHRWRRTCDADTMMAERICAVQRCKR